MQLKELSRVELIIAGIGGMGVLVAGRLLASAALQRYRFISWMPTYGEARRGGPSECTVILSDEEIASPILDQAQKVMLLDGSQLKAFETRVRPDGLMIVESAGLKDELQREDCRLLRVSGLKTAMSIGGMLVNNMILLGVYIEMVKPIPSELIEKELDRTYGDREAILERNKEAFRKGLELAKTLAA
jgi:2-oxoglutarate ferredoxin oxidoreductase subunit gamma